MGSIYKITNTVNGKSYIGQTVNDAMKGRIPLHLRGKGSPLIANAIAKYGESAFDIVILHNNIFNFMLDILEIEAIAKFNTLAPNGYNLEYGGRGGKPSLETRQKLSEAHKGQIPWNKGKKASPEARRKMSKAQKGKKLSEETRRKLSEVKKGKIRSPEHCRKMSDINKGRKHSPESRQNMSKAHKGKTCSPETRRKMSEAQKRRRAKEKASKE